MTNYYHGLDLTLLNLGNKAITPLQNHLLESKQKNDSNFTLNCDITSLPSPFLLPAIKDAIKTIDRHIKNKGKILISGDKDSDGVCATVLLGSFLKKQYDSIFFDFSTNEDYGFSPPLIQSILEEKPDLLIALDFGTVHKKEIQTLQENGIEVVVIDHHEPSEQLPDCCIINPKKKDSLYPEKNLCTAHLTFLFVAAYLQKEEKTNIDSQTFWKNLSEQPYFQSELLANLDLVSIATITDMMPLTESNRVLVKEGCKILTKILKDNFNYSRVGTKVLLNHFKEHLSEINSHILGWKIGPLINAAGRMKKTEIVLKFFLAKEEEEAQSYLSQILELNKQRKSITIKNIEISESQISLENPEPILFFYSDKMKSGVSGIVANEFVKKYQKPTIFIAPETKFARGSIRTTGKENVLNLLKKSKNFLIQYGGHKQAGGFSVSFENIDKFKEDIIKNSYEWWEKESEQDSTFQGSIVSFQAKDFQKSIIEELEIFEPFGISNSNPLFSIKNASIYNYTKMKEIHAKFRILSSDPSIDCIIWNEAKNFDKKISSYENFDFWGVLEKNFYKRRCKVQFIILYFCGNRPINEV